MRYEQQAGSEEAPKPEVFVACMVPLPYLLAKVFRSSFVDGYCFVDSWILGRSFWYRFS